MAVVDIIIPAFNAAHYLPRALDSVERQTFSEWRILLIDDGSTDNTAEVLAPYRERLGNKLLYVHKQNAGLAAARNTAIANSTADFLALLDADDLWLPNRLADTLARFRGHPEVGLVYGFVHRIDAQDRVLDTFATRNPLGEGDVAAAIYSRRLDLPCPTVTFRRSCVQEVGGFDESMRATEDRDLWLRIAQRWQVGLAPSVTALYRISSNSMSTDAERMLRSQMQFLNKHYGERGCGWKQRRIALSRMYQQRAELFADRGQRGLALRNALWSALNYPFAPANLRALAAVAMRFAGLRRSRRIDPARSC